MRHGKKVNHLGRTSSHRKALLSNLAISLITYKRIKTTVAKAKALRIYVEPLLNRGKEDTTHNRRIVFSYLQHKESISELFGPIAAKIGDRAGGYTRIVRLGQRFGDAAEIAMIELVDFNEDMLGEKKAAGAKKKRTRRAGGTAKATETKPEAKKEVAAAPVVDVAAPEVAEDTTAAAEDTQAPEAQADEAQEDTQA